MKVAVVGTGAMGQNHVRIFSEYPSVDLVAICDVDEKRGRMLSRKFHCRYYKSYEEMVHNEKLDAVSIAVPTFLHCKIGSFFLKRGIHTLLEKPIASTPGEARSIISTAKESGAILMVGHIERFNPAVRKLKELVSGGEIGEITSIITRRVGGFPPQVKDVDIAVDLAIHDIDIVNYLLDSLPDTVVMNKQKHHLKKRADSVEMFLTYSKASVYIQSNWITPVKIRKITITGTKGYVEMDYIHQTIELYKSNYTKFLQATEEYSDYILTFSDPDVVQIPIQKKEPLKEEISFFVEAIKKNKKVDPTHALEALEIALTKT